MGSKDQVLKNQERMILNCVGARIRVRKGTQKTLLVVTLPDDSPYTLAGSPSQHRPTSRLLTSRSSALWWCKCGDCTCTQRSTGSLALSSRPAPGPRVGGTAPLDLSKAREKYFVTVLPQVLLLWLCQF